MVKYVKAAEMPIEMNYIDTWYRSVYPADALGEAIEHITFDKLFSNMQNHIDAYDSIGVVDSIVRERIFKELSARKHLAYDTVYNMWMASDV